MITPSPTEDLPFTQEYASHAAMVAHSIHYCRRLFEVFFVHRFRFVSILFQSWAHLDYLVRRHSQSVIFRNIVSFMVGARHGWPMWLIIPLLHRHQIYKFWSLLFSSFLARLVPSGTLNFLEEIIFNKTISVYTSYYAITTKTDTFRLLIGILLRGSSTMSPVQITLMSFWSGSGKRIKRDFDFSTSNFSFTMMTNCAIVALNTIIICVQLFVWAAQKHQGYKKRFVAYPVSRRAFIPGLF